MKKYLYLSAAICLILSIGFLLSSCNSKNGSSNTHSNTTESTSNINESQSQTSAFSVDEQLELFNNLTIEEIEKIDIVRLDSESGEKLMYKSFSDADDVHSITNILKNSNVHGDTNSADTNGWTTLVKIWLKDNNDLILITPYSDNKVTINSYVYSVNDGFEQKIVNLYNNSEIKAEEYK